MVVLSGFGNRVMLTSYNELGIIPFSFIFWKNLKYIGVDFSFFFFSFFKINLFILIGG